MKKTVCSLMLMLMAVCGIFFFTRPSMAAVESLTEGVSWSGTVDEIKFLSFVPEETGYYDTELVNYSREEVEGGGRVIETVSQEKLAYFGEGEFRNAIYMQKGVAYTIQLNCYSDDTEYASGEFSFCITKSQDEVESVGAEQISTTAYVDGNKVFSLKPGETGTYAFTFSLMKENYYDFVLYQLEGEKLVKKEAREGSYSEGKISQFRCQLEAGQEYYLEVYVGDYGMHQGEEIPVNVQLCKDKNVVGIQVVDFAGKDINSNQWTIYGEVQLKIMFEDGSSEILRTMVHSNADTAGIQGVCFEYLGEIDSEEYLVAGKQPVRFTYLNEFVATWEITVLTRLESTTATLKENEKVTTSEYMHSREYRFTPKKNGFYGLWGNGGVSDYYEEWEYTMYDAQDNKLSFVSGEGYKLEAGKTYYFEIWLYGPLTSDSFTYWLGVNTNHVHSYGPWTVTKEATQTAAGEEKRVCSSCGAIQTRDIAQLGTTPTTEPTVKPTPSPEPGVKNTDGNSSLALKKTSIKKAVSKAKKKMQVSWNAVKDAQKYEVQYSLKKNMKKAKTKIVKGTKVTIKGLKKKKKYYVRVRAFSVVNGKKVYGAYSAKKTVRVK